MCGRVNHQLSQAERVIRPIISGPSSIHKLGVIPSILVTAENSK